MKLLLSPEQAADALHVGRTTVYEQIASGRLESVRIGRSRRVSLDALKRFVENLEAEQRRDAIGE
jgi:excisionase family DNA binding protein